MPLALAQEVIAVEGGFANWAALKAASADRPGTPRPDPGAAMLKGAVPTLFVRNVAAAVEFYREMLGFEVDFLHGSPAFYAAVSRDGVCLHPRFVHRINFAELATAEESLILATIEVTNVKMLFEVSGARCGFRSAPDQAPLGC